MKTASEVAEELAVYSRRDSVGAVALKEAIAQALTAYAEERVKETTESFMADAILADKIARAEALEQAAKIVETADAPWEEYLERNAGLTSLKAFEVFAAERIRALREKP